jgi:hypothetical protein
MTDLELKRYLEERTGYKVDLHVTDNRRAMITCKLNREEGLDVRVHKMFLDAPAKVLRSLASFCKRPTKSNRAVVGTFIEENAQAIREKKAEKPPPEKRITRGRVHDLDALFAKLNKKYFSGKCTSAYTWGQKPPASRRRRRSIRFGNYNYETNTIRMHPALDRKYVPTYVVEVVLYHEMLHWYIPPVKKNGRTYFHTRLFRQAEESHPMFEKATRWKEKNLNRLLKS